jgi:diguanylate cyclase
LSSDNNKVDTNSSYNQELDNFLSQSTLVFKKWSLFGCLLIYVMFTVIDYFRFPPETYKITIPLKILFVILPLIVSMYLHWFRDVKSIRAHMKLHLFIYFNVGLLHIMIFAFAKTLLDSHFSELGFVLLILFGCLMMMLPVAPTLIVSAVLLFTMFVVNALSDQNMMELVFRMTIYSLLMCLCLIVNISLHRLLIANHKIIQQLYGDSITDRLTGLKNRRYFVQQTIDLIEKAKAEKKKISLLVIDIDNFKEMNDKHGHSYGDDRLTNLGEILRSVCIREHDFPCRLSGDEFAIVMYDAEQADVSKVCQDLLTDIQLYDMAVSIGTVSTKVDELTSDSLLKDKLFEEADKALYKAKDSGRNTYYSAPDLI